MNINKIIAHCTGKNMIYSNLLTDKPAIFAMTTNKPVSKTALKSFNGKALTKVNG